MSSARLLIKLASVPAIGAAIGTAWYGATKWKISTNVQTGIISNTGHRGLFIKTNEMTLQRSRVSTGHANGDMEMSLFENPELVAKAKQYCEQGTFVRVSYDKFFASPLFKAGSSRKVINIEVVNEVSSQQTSTITSK